MKKKLIFLGDISLHGFSECSKYPFVNIKRLMNEHHFIGNLESPFRFSDNEEKTHKIVLNSDRRNIDFIKGFKAFSLANNHIQDLGVDSACKTIKILNENDLTCFGYGQNLCDARTPAVIDVGDTKIFIIGYSCLTTNGENYATSSDFGVAPISLSYILEDIKNLKDNNIQNIIVSLHWGVENSHMPTPDQISIARQIIDGGADFVWGHHAHVIQPVQKYKEKPIAYCLGNFLFNDINLRDGAVVSQKKENRESLGVSFFIEDKKIRFEKTYLFKYNGITVDIMPEEELSFDYSYCVKKVESYKPSLFEEMKMEVFFNGKIFQTKYSLDPIGKKSFLSKKWSWGVKTFNFNRKKEKIQSICYLLRRYKNTFNCYPNLIKPKTFNEKINFIKLFCRDQLQTIIADKYEVRKYVERKVGKNILNEMYAVYDNVGEIEFEKLPKSFVLKATHGSGWNIIVEEKDEIDVSETKERLSKWLNTNYYDLGREWCYKNIKPRIIAEKFLIDENNKLPTDYKFHCFNGAVKIIQIDLDRLDDHTRALYYRNFQKINVEYHFPKYEGEYCFPPNIKEMIAVAENLSRDFKYIRVDLYNIDGKIVFGEMTNYPGNGFEKFFPARYDKIFGDMLKL